MTNILSIETSAAVCSVAIHADGELISLGESIVPGAHAERLMLLVEEVLLQAKIQFSELDAIAVAEGPGSYTGLRIGVSTAKGLAFGLGKPLIAINTLQALASSVQLKKGELVIPVLDARRMEVFREVFDWELKSVATLDAEVLSESSFQNFLEKHPVYFLGDAVDKVESVVRHDRARFLTDTTFSARHMGGIAFDHYQKGQFADLAYFVPNYLKEFKALHSKKNPLLSL